VELDELSTEGEAEAGSLRPVLGGADLPEFLKHRVVMLGRDADARVRDGRPGDGSSAGSRMSLSCNRG
jgi:hypothetical protein